MNDFTLNQAKTAMFDRCTASAYLIVTWVVAYLLIEPLFAEESPRAWMDAKGRTIQATFIEVSDGQVQLRNQADNKEYAVPLSRLSAKDQQYALETNTTNKWKIDEWKVQAVEGAFRSGDASSPVVIGASGENKLVIATWKLSPVLPDANAIERYKKLNPDLPEEEQKKLDGEYRPFAMKHLIMVDPDGNFFHAKYMAKPTAQISLKIGASGKGTVSVSGGVPGWRFSKSVTIADDASIGKEEVRVGSDSNSYVALIDVGREPVEVNAVFAVNKDTDLSGLNLRFAD